MPLSLLERSRPALSAHSERCRQPSGSEQICQFGPLLPRQQIHQQMNAAASLHCHQGVLLPSKPSWRYCRLCSLALCYSPRMPPPHARSSKAMTPMSAPKKKKREAPSTSEPAANRTAAISALLSKSKWHRAVSHQKLLLWPTIKAMPSSTVPFVTRTEDP